jgi:hypothetical protein
MAYFNRFALQLAVALIVLEVMCRLFLGQRPMQRYDKRYDRLTAPNQAFVEVLEGFARGRTNELGNLDGAMPNPLPKHAILVVGDSLAEARQVSMSERWSNVLGTLLNRHVYNAGHSGWSPANVLEYLRAEKHRFEPETVVLQVSGNDLDDIMAKKRPHVVDDAGVMSIKLPKRKKSGMAAKINRAKELVSRSALGGNLIVAGLTMVGAGNGGSGIALGCTPPDANVEKAARWLFGEIQKQHPNTVVVYFPTLNYYDGCLDQCIPSRDLFRSVTTSAKLGFVDITEAACRRFEQTRQPLHGFWNTVPGVGHLNAEGNAVAAQVVADYLRSVEGAP